MIEDVLTQAELKRLLRYDPATGMFTWRVSLSNRAPAGFVVGLGRPPSQYIAICIRGHQYLAHRLAWLYMRGRWPAEDIDHKNTNRSDNRWENLREATRQQNIQNANRRSNNTSGVKGVSWDPRIRKWATKIKANGRNIRIGSYESREDAARAYAAAADRYFGDFARAA